MRYAIVESGGKQYRAVEGEMLEVDRLPAEEGKQIDLEHVLMMADGDQFMIGTPIVKGIEIKATIVDHFSGRKVTHFRYSPKKRIRVRGGHREQYTRLMVDFIGSKGEDRHAAKPESKAEAPLAEKTAAGKAAKQPEKKSSAPRAEKKTPVRTASRSPKPAATAGQKKSGK